MPLQPGRSLRIAVAALALSIVPVARAQSTVGQLGVPFSGCGVYACYTLTLTETGRSGPLLPILGGPPYPNNVPSYQVGYALGGIASPTAAPFTLGASLVRFGVGIGYDDGMFGEGGCCALADIPLGGFAPGDVIPFRFDLSIFGPFYLPVGAPDGAAGFGFGTTAYENIDAGPFPLVVPGEFAVELAPLSAVPEPSAVWLLGTGLLALGGLATGRRARA